MDRERVVAVRLASEEARLETPPCENTAEELPTPPFRTIIDRGGRLLLVCLALGFLAAGATVVGLARRNLERVEQVSAQAHQATALRQEIHTLVALVGEDPTTARPSVAAGKRLRSTIRDMLDSDSLHGETPARIRELDQLLGDTWPIERTDAVSALALVRSILDAEGEAELDLLAEVHQDSRAEFRLILATVGGLAVLGSIGAWSLRRRVLRPLDGLRTLLAQLGEGDFSRMSTENAAPLVLPLLDNYNYLVTRLEELEAEHLARAESLEGEVRDATRALLEQHHTTARAERLALIGEMSGRLAHELRNPLAGIRMSLSNLRKEVIPELAERIDTLVDETDRLTRMLNQHLSDTKHDPEPLEQIDLHDVMGDLAGLLRYQIPENVQLECRAASGVVAQLPPDRLRQALLNLILNSVQEFDGKPGTVTLDAISSDETLTISVSDDGPGFPKDVLVDGSRPFVTHRPGGTGLGLPVAWRLALDLGGRLELTNPPTGGARVAFHLPHRHAR